MTTRWAALMSMVVCGCAYGQSGPHIPETHAKTLSGERVDLPQALVGKAGVLVLGFSQASRGQVTDWDRRLSGYRNDTGVAYYELGLFASVPGLLRGWVLDRVKNSMPSHAQETFVAVTDHEPEWKRAAGFNQGDDAYVLVVDGSGVVRWRFQGPPAEDVYRQLRQQVDAARIR